MKVQMTERYLKSDDNQDKEDDILSHFHTREGMEVSKLYDTYRSLFVKYAVKYFSTDLSVIEDIYQESFLTLYKNIINGKITTLKCSLSTYLFAIGKIKLLNYEKGKKKYYEVDLNDHLLKTEIETEGSDWNKKQEIVYQMVREMPDPCRRVLSLYYWNRKSMREIALEMNYKNEQIAKNRKHFCLKSFKEKLIEKFNEEELI